jgi:hypothetical protein
VETFLKRWFVSLFTPKRPDKILISLGNYLHDFNKYRALDKLEKVKILDTQPELYDRLPITPFDYHYVYQATWAFEHILSSKPKIHLDIGSQIQFVASLAILIPTILVDIRPVKANFRQMNRIGGSILRLPFSNSSIKSISCLHVAEHIGLGRYGEPLNPLGTMLACKELERVLAINGSLFFSLPIGYPRVSFNAHRIHSVKQILAYFDNLQLNEFSMVSDEGKLLHDLEPGFSETQEYACGLFWFRKGV